MITPKSYVMSLDEVEQKRYEAFSKKHYAAHKFRGGVPVTLTPNGIGLSVKVKCPKCGKEKDVSNVDTW